MVMYIIIISFIFTIVILLMSIFTISKGYGYKHKVDSKSDVDPIVEKYIYEPDNRAGK